jgi:hypothetical protein
MTSPRHTSSKIPGLVMWDNGCVVRVRVDDEGRIVRGAITGLPEVHDSFGRFNTDDAHLERIIFSHVEQRLADLRFLWNLTGLLGLEKLVQRRARQRRGGT